MGFKKYLLGCSLLLAGLSGAVTMADMPVGVLAYSGDAITPPGFVMMVDDTTNPTYMVYMRQYPVGADEQNPYVSQSYNYAGMQSYTPATNEAIPTNALKDLLISSNGTSTWVVSGGTMYDPGNRSDRVYDATDAGDGDYNLMTVNSAGDSQRGPYFIANSFNTNRQNKIRTIYTTYYTPPDTSLSGHIARCGTNSGSINISEQECIGLAYLYDEAGGAYWTNSNGWFSNTDVSLWESSSCYSPVDGDDFCSSVFAGPELRRGVALTGSNVTGGGYTVYGINLPANNLIGAISSGFAYFPNLVIADVQDNGLTSVDVSHNPLLRELDISDQDSNPTSWTTDFTQNPALRSLNIDGLKFYDVDLSANTALEYLDADSNHLSGINLSGLNVLRSVDISYNDFSDWNAIIIPSSVLHDLDVSNNSIYSINLSDYFSLVELYASDNGLTSITLGELPNLDTLDVSNNELSEIDLSGVYNIHDLDIHFNNLSVLDISNTEHIQTLNASSNQLTQFTIGDIEEHNGLEDLSLAYNGLCYIEDEDTINFLTEVIGEGWQAYQFFCAPRDLTATPGDHTAALTWRAPAQSADNSGDATPLYYTVAMMGGTGEYQVDNETFSFDFGGLTNNITFVFRVCAVHGNEGPNRTVCETVDAVPGGETPSPEPTHGGGGGGRHPDECPNGDTSPSYYDGLCGDEIAPITGQSHKTIGLLDIEASIACLDPEYQLAYLFSLKYNITTMPSCIDANMDGLLLRKEAAKMMSNYAMHVLGKTPDNNKACDFSDMSDESVEMQQYAIAACRLGIMGLEFDGVNPSKTFNPNGLVDKAQFATILDRLINGRSHDGNAACWYCDHVSALQDAGVITVTTDLFDPLKRAFAMIMLMRTKKNNYTNVNNDSSRLELDK